MRFTKKLNYIIMKSISTVLFAILLFCAMGVMSQELPKKGAILVMKEKSFNLKPGESITTSIELIRSKICRKTKFGELSAGTPDGITINFEKDIENNDLYLMTLLADESASKKSYTIIIKGKGVNAHKIRGMAIKINPAQNQMVTANQ